MPAVDDRPPSDGRADTVDLRIRASEREAALAAIEAHLIDHRLEPAEYELRAEACRRARTQAELVRIFADLPAPHPVLPAAAGLSAAEPDQDDDVRGASTYREAGSGGGERRPVSRVTGTRMVNGYGVAFIIH